MLIINKTIKFKVNIYPNSELDYTVEIRISMFLTDTTATLYLLINQQTT